MTEPDPSLALDALPLRRSSENHCYKMCDLRSQSGQVVRVLHYFSDGSMLESGRYAMKGEWYVWLGDTWKVIDNPDVLRPLDPLSAQAIIYHYMSL